MKSLIGSILIVIALFLGYQGVQSMNQSKDSLEIGNLEITASDKDKKDNAYLYIGGGVLLLLGGIYLVGQGKK